MNLSNVTLLPGVVVSADDPKNLGRVKCIIAGKSDPDTMNQDHLPWCAPFTCMGYQRVFKPMEGQKIWVLHDETNYYEYYWIPAWEVNSNTELMTPNSEYDVLVSRSGDGCGSQMFYDRQSGFMTRIGNVSYTNMTIGGDIINESNKVQMSVKGSHVHLGVTEKEGEEQPLVMGNDLVTLLNDLKKAFQGLQQKASSSPYTSALAPGFLECVNAIQNNIDLLSNTCHTTK